MKKLFVYKLLFCVFINCIANAKLTNEELIFLKLAIIDGDITKVRLLTKKAEPEELEKIINEDLESKIEDTIKYHEHAKLNSEMIIEIFRDLYNIYVLFVPIWSIITVMINNYKTKQKIDFDQYISGWNKLKDIYFWMTIFIYGLNQLEKNNKHWHKRNKNLIKALKMENYLKSLIEKPE